MFKYFIKRLLLIVPTLLGVTVICFLITITAPGGPIEQKIAQLRLSGMEASGGGPVSGNDYGVSQEVIEALKKQYGFDKPVFVQYLIWLKNAVTLDFGESFIYEEPVTNLILERVPVSLQFGLVSFVLIYLVCIILGVSMAVRKDKGFDVASTVTIIVLYAIPSLMLGILLKVFFCRTVGLVSYRGSLLGYVF